MLSADVNCQSYISFAVAGFVLSHFMRVTMEARLNLKIAGTLITHIQANSKLANQNPLLTGMAKLFTNLEWKGLVASNPSPDQIVDVNLSLLSWLTNNLVNIPLDQLDIVVSPKPICHH